MSGRTTQRRKYSPNGCEAVKFGAWEAFKDKPLSLSEVNQENAWTRSAASAGLPLHAVDNTELKFYIHLISQGRSKLPNRRALRTTILDRVAANVDVSMAATLKTVKGGTPR